MPLIKKTKKTKELDTDKIAQVISALKGDDGYTPKKGKDYFDGETPTDAQLIKLIKPLIPRVKDGEDGHTPTKTELMEIIKPLIPKIRNGIDGKNPSKEEIIAIIKPLIPEYKSITCDEVIEEINSQKEILDIKTIRGLSDEINNRMPKNMIGSPRIRMFDAGGERNAPLGSLKVIGGSLTNNGQDYVISIPAGSSSQTLAQTLALGNSTGANDIIVSTGQQIKGQTDLTLSHANGDNYYYAGPTYLFQQWYDGLGTGNTDFLLQGNGTQLFSHTSIDIQTDTGLYNFYEGTGFSGTLDFSNLTGNKTYTLPNTTGTLALTSDLGAYWKNDGSSSATGNWNIGAYSLTNTGDVTFGGAVGSDYSFSSQSTDTNQTTHFYSDGADTVYLDIINSSDINEGHFVFGTDGLAVLEFWGTSYADRVTFMDGVNAIDTHDQSISVGSIRYMSGLRTGAIGVNLPGGFIDSNLSSDGTNIYSSTGKLGLGITTAVSKLHIDGGTATASDLRFTAGTTTGQTTSDGFQIGITTAGVAEIRQREAQALQFFTSNVNYMSLGAGAPTLTLDSQASNSTNAGTIVFRTASGSESFTQTFNASTNVFSMLYGATTVFSATSTQLTFPKGFQSTNSFSYHTSASGGYYGYLMNGEAGHFYDGVGNEMAFCTGTYALAIDGPFRVVDGASAGTGVTGDLLDSTSTKIADVINGVIVAMGAPA